MCLENLFGGSKAQPVQTPARAADPVKTDTGAQVKAAPDMSTASSLFGKAPKKSRGATVPGLNL